MIKLSLVAILLGGCTLAQMPVGPNMQAQQPFDRSLSRGDLRFGAYRVAGFSTSFTDDEERLPTFVMKREVESSNDDYAFRLEETGAAAHPARCRSHTRVEKAHDGRFTMSTTEQWLRCAVWTAPDAPAARLDLRGDGKGELVVGDHRFAIESRDVRGRLSGAFVAGYALRDGDRDLVVAQRVNGGAVWIDREVGGEDRALLATAAAALLLFEPAE